MNTIRFYFDVLRLMAIDWDESELEQLLPELAALHVRMEQLIQANPESEPDGERRPCQVDRPSAVSLDSFPRAHGKLGEPGPAVPGFYMLLGSDDDLPLYIGRGARIRSRLAAHANNYRYRQAGWERWSAWMIEDSQTRTQIEGYLISEMRPPLNIAGPR